MKLTRKQELALINFGMSKLLEQLVPIETKPRKTTSTRKRKRKWSKAQHEKFARTMKAVWKKKKVGKHGQTL